MIATGETNEYAAEVAFTLPLDSDPLTGLTGWAFTLGEVQIKLPGDIWINVAVNKIVEKGYGRFCARLSADQCAAAGDVYIKAEVAATQYYFGSDVIGELGGDIPSGSSVGSISFFLPDENDPINNPPLTGHLFATGEVRICLPDGVYVDADVGNITEIGYGGYKLTLTSAETAKRGKAFLYAKVAGYQRFEGYSTILGVGAAAAVTVPAPTPVAVPVAIGDPEYTSHLSAAMSRLPEQFRSGTLPVDFDVDEFELLLAGEL